MHKDFVRERGFVKLISPFREVIGRKDGVCSASTNQLGLHHWF